MNWKEILQSNRQGLKDEELLDEAISLLEKGFELGNLDDIVHKNKDKALAYLALLHCKEKLKSIDNTFVEKEKPNNSEIMLKQILINQSAFANIMYDFSETYLKNSVISSSLACAIADGTAEALKETEVGNE